MIFIQTVISNLSILAILRTGFLLYICININFGQLSQYLDYLEYNEIEITEEKDLESEEKRDKEENEKDDFMKNTFAYEFLDQEHLHSLHNIYWFWALTHKDIPTPPPKGFVV